MTKATTTDPTEPPKLYPEGEYDQRIKSTELFETRMGHAAVRIRFYDEKFPLWYLVGIGYQIARKKFGLNPLVDPAIEPKDLTWLHDEYVRLRVKHVCQDDRIYIRVELVEFPGKIPWRIPIPNIHSYYPMPDFISKSPPKNHVLSALLGGLAGIIVALIIYAMGKWS